MILPTRSTSPANILRIVHYVDLPLAVTDLVDGNSIFFGLVSVGQNSIETVLSSKESANDFKHITHMQSVLAKIMEMYT